MESNTSQDPEYVGPTYHEKKVHKTHFTVERDWKSSDDGEYEWVEIRPGRWKRQRKNENG